MAFDRPVILQMTTRRIVLTIVALALLAITYELGWESGTTQLVAHSVEFSA